MEGKTVSSVFCSLLTVYLLSMGAQPASAAVVFDDHFTGDSGGVPVGWAQVSGSGTVVEYGSLVYLNGPVIMVSNATVDPNAGTLTLTVDIAGMSDEVNPLGVGLVDLTATHLLLAQLYMSDLRLEVAVSNTGGNSWLIYEATHLTGYASASLRLTLVLEPTAFSIASDAPAFSSGLIEYATVFPGFGRSDLGSACYVAIAQSTDDPGAASSSIDRVTVNVVPAVATKSTTFGQFKALYGR